MHRVPNLRSLLPWMLQKDDQTAIPVLSFEGFSDFQVCVGTAPTRLRHIECNNNANQTAPLSNQEQKECHHLRLGQQGTREKNLHLEMVGLKKQRGVPR